MKPKRSFGQISLDALLGAAGIKLIAVEDAEALDRVRARLVPLQRVDHGVVKTRIVVKFTPDFMRKIGSLGGLKSCRGIQEKALSEINRAKALKRWHGVASPQCKSDIGTGNEALNSLSSTLTNAGLDRTQPS